MADSNIVAESSSIHLLEQALLGEYRRRPPNTPPSEYAISLYKCIKSKQNDLQLALQRSSLKRAVAQMHRKEQERRNIESFVDYYRRMPCRRGGLKKTCRKILRNIECEDRNTYMIRAMIDSVKDRDSDDDCDDLCDRQSYATQIDELCRALSPTVPHSEPPCTT